ncbi:MAG: enoyl-CoA hydratase/isomerase family protein [Rhodobacteraceae bacterium]|nr:enoyl-CoA hydratase/isomerase family protein [Paracoccaceae bacterium]
MTDSVLIDDREGIRVITLNRPERMNALDGPTLIALDEAIATAGAARVIVIRGTGRAFCAGNDLKWLASGVLADRAAHMAHQDRMQACYTRIESCPQVVVASVGGFALAGGFELMLACDITLTADEAELGDEHLRRNLLPSGGSSQRLPRRIGPARALYHLLTAKRMTGRGAAAMGLAALSVPGDQLEAETMALAERLAQSDPLALASMKEMVRRGLELPLSEGLAMERWMQHRYRTQSASLDASVTAFAGGKG